MSKDKLPARTIDFGVPDVVDPHHFVVHIPAGSTEDIEIEENFGIHASSDEDSRLLRCRLSRRAWNGIRDEAKRILNERLKEKDLKAGRWNVGANKVERLLGRELCVLAWSVEAAQPDAYPAACAAWAALKPEEKWWLFRMCDAATGAAEDADIGWRKALRIALTETPGPHGPTKKMNRKTPKGTQNDQFLLPINEER
jgi:hypothetical protein